MSKRFSEKEKSKILSRLNSSGLSRAQFCRREELCYQTVSKWISKPISKTSLALVEVKPEKESLAKSSDVRVRIGGAVEVEFGGNVSMRALAIFCREVAGC